MRAEREVESRHFGIGMCADFMQDYLRILGLFLTAYSLEMRNRHFLTGLTYIAYTPSRCLYIVKSSRCIAWALAGRGAAGRSRSPAASSSACASRVLKSALTRAEAIVAAAFTHNTHTHTHTHTHTNQHNPCSPTPQEHSTAFVRMACKSIRAGIRRLTYYPFHPHPPTLQQLPILFRA